MTQMRLANAFLANYAEVRGGLAYISGAFPEWFDAPTLPTIGGFQLVLNVQLEPHEVGRTVVIEVRIRRPGGELDQIGMIQTTSVRGPDESGIPGAPINWVVIAPLPTQIGSEGLHAYVIDFPQHELQSVELAIAVRRVPPPATLGITPPFTQQLFGGVVERS